MEILRTPCMTNGTYFRTPEGFQAVTRTISNNVGVNVAKEPSYVSDFTTMDLSAYRHDLMKQEIVDDVIITENDVMLSQNDIMVAQNDPHSFRRDTLEVQTPSTGSANLTTIFLRNNRGSQNGYDMEELQHHQQQQKQQKQHQYVVSNNHGHRADMMMLRGGGGKMLSAKRSIAATREGPGANNSIYLERDLSPRYSSAPNTTTDHRIYITDRHYLDSAPSPVSTPPSYDGPTRDVVYDVDALRGGGHGNHRDGYEVPIYIEDVDDDDDDLSSTASPPITTSPNDYNSSSNFRNININSISNFRNMNNNRINNSNSINNNSNSSNSINNNSNSSNTTFSPRESLLLPDFKYFNDRLTMVDAHIGTARSSVVGHLTTGNVGMVMTETTGSFADKKAQMKKIKKKEETSNTVLPPCRICGSKASGFHYGVNSCEACKGFFRRALKRPMDYFCSKNGSCFVKGFKRNQCRYCRYKRCLSLGMSKEAIKTGRYSHSKKTKDIIEVKRLQNSAGMEPELEDLDLSLLVNQLSRSHAVYLKPPKYTTENELFRWQLEYRDYFMSQKKPNSACSAQGACSAQRSQSCCSHNRCSSDVKDTDCEGKHPNETSGGQVNNQCGCHRNSSINGCVNSSSTQCDVKCVQESRSCSCNCDCKQQDQQQQTPPSQADCNPRGESKQPCNNDTLDLSSSPSNESPSFNSDLHLRCTETTSHRSPICSRKRSISPDKGQCNEQCQGRLEDILLNKQPSDPSCVLTDGNSDALLLTLRGGIQDGVKLAQPETETTWCGGLGMLREPKEAGAKRAEGWVRGYVNFARVIPGFTSLTSQDQAALLRVAWDEVWLLGAYRGYSTDLGVAVMPSGRCFHVTEMEAGWGRGYAGLSFHLADVIKGYNLTPTVTMMLKVICILSPDRCDLTDTKSVDDLHWLAVRCLLHHLQSACAEDTLLFPRLVSLLTSLRDLSQSAQRSLKGRMTGEGGGYGFLSESFSPF